MNISKDNPAVFLFKISLIVILGMIIIYFLIHFVVNYFFIEKEEFIISQDGCISQDFIMLEGDKLSIVEPNTSLFLKSAWDNHAIIEVIECDKKVEVEENVKICVDKYKEEGNATWCIMSDVINIKWLDENCLCQDCAGTWDTVYEHYVTCDIKCSGYKCGEYFVEVLG